MTCALGYDARVLLPNGWAGESLCSKQAARTNRIEMPDIRKTLGDFQIIRELGRGGMGIVFEARQISLNRKVALKVLGDSLGMTAKAVVRFRREAEAAAKLHHTNIVPIYATGEHEGTHYYAMELVEGPSLNHVIRNLQMVQRQEAQGPRPSRAQSHDPVGATKAQGEHPADSFAVGESTVSAMPEWVAKALAPEEASTASKSAIRDSSSTLSGDGRYFDTVAKMIADVADGLEYAHNHGVIHRDMKPSNLLLSPDGRLSINDFGLARMLEQPGMTMTGEFVGSPLYMSPEQIAAGRAPLDHRTDIYSLGATLYELLALAPPFVGERRDQIIAQIIHKEPRPPRSVNKKIPVDLETICLKAMEKDPDRRYQTAGQLAEDLRRYINRFEISAKRVGVVGRTVKWVRRHPGVAALLGLVILAGAAAGVAAYQVRLSNQRMAAMQLDKAKEDALLAAWSGQFESAERDIQEAERLGVSHAWARMLRAQVAFHQDRPDEAIEHLEQAIRLVPDSLVARAMMAKALNWIGRWDLGVMMLDDLEKLTPKTAEDFLFLGWARAMVTPYRGLDALDEAVRMRPSSPIARVVRADARANHANDTGDPVDVEAALDDARTAKSLLPDSAFVLETHLYANLVAATVYGQRRESEKQAVALGEAKEDVGALERFQGFPGAIWARGTYFLLTGANDDAFDVWKKALESEHPSDDAFTWYAHLLQSRGKYDQAIVILDRLDERGGSAEGDLARGYFAMFEGKPDAQQAALAAYATAMARKDSSLMVLWHQTILWLLGREQEAMDACPALDERFARLPKWVLEWYQHLLDFGCDRIGEKELLTAAGDSRRCQCEGQYFIGIRRLSKGDRTGAVEHFRRSVDTGVFDFLEYNWSRRFLERVREDPTWPPWIPLRSEEDAKETAPNSTSNGDGK